MVNRKDDRVDMSWKARAAEVFQTPQVALNRLFNRSHLGGERRRLQRLPGQIHDPLLGHNSSTQSELRKLHQRHFPNRARQAGGQTIPVATVLEEANRMLGE